VTSSHVSSRDVWSLHVHAVGTNAPLVGAPAYRLST